MKRAALAFLALFAFAGLAAADTIPINQFGGLNSDDSPIALQNQTPDAENVVSDDGPGLKGRFGFISFSTEPASSMWEFPVSNGTRYLIRAYKSTGTLKATSGDGAFTITIATIPTDRDVAATPLGDKFFFTDTLNGIKYWNTSTVTVVSPTLTFDKLVNFKGRLVGAGVAANQRVLYFSKYLDGTNFTLATVPTDDDPTQITVAGALDENITALYSSFQDKLVWFKTHSFGAIYGSRRSNYTQRTFSDVTGTGTPESVRDCVDKLRWLGPDRKIWEFDGTTFYKITEDIDTLMATVGQGDANARSNTQTSQSDFLAGTFSPSNFGDTTSILGSLTPKTMTLLETNQADFVGSCVPSLFCDTTTVSGSLVPRTFNTTETSQSDWSAMTYDNTLYVDTVTAAGDLRLAFPDDFSTNRLATFYSNGCQTSPGDSCTFSVAGGLLGVNHSSLSNTDWGGTVRTKLKFTLSAGATFFFRVTNSNGSIPGATTYFVLNSSDTTDLGILSTSLGPHVENGRFYVSFAAASANTIMFTKVVAVDGNGTSQINATPAITQYTLPVGVRVNLTATTYSVFANDVLVSSGTHTWPLYSCWAGFAVQTGISGGTVGFSYDDFTMSPQTFTVTSPALDTGMTSPTWSTLTDVESGTTGTITYQSQVSDDNISYDAAVSASTGTDLTSASKRYLQMKTLFTFAPSTFPSTGMGIPMTLSSYNTLAYGTGTYTSQTFDTGFVPPVWGLFNPSTTTFGTGGSLNFFTQSSSDGTTWDARVAASSATKVASATKRYLRYQADMLPNKTTSYTSIDQVSIPAKSTGTFTSQTISIGSAITAWGPFTASDAPGNGSITYQISTSAVSGVFNTWTTIASGATPAISLAPYAAARVIFSLDVATDTPRVDDITISWTEGSTIKTASAYFNNRYWLSVAISSTVNNRILVYDKKKQWQRYTGINADALVLYNSKLYFANSGGIFQAESGFSDNGAPITAYYRTATFSPNKLDLYSNFDYLYMTTDTSDSTLTTSFQVQGIPTDYNLGSVQMNASTGFQNFKLPFGQAEVQTAKFINFKWQVSGTSFWRIDNGTLYFQPMPLPE